MLVNILSFIVKFYIAALIFRYILTQQEMYFNSFARTVGRLTDPMFKAYNRSKSFSDKMIPPTIFAMITVYAIICGISHHIPDTVGNWAYQFLNYKSILPYMFLAYSEMLDFLTLFFICCLLIGGLSDSSSGSFPLYFYRLGNIWVKPVKALLKIRNNFVIIPSLIMIMAIYFLADTVLNNIIALTAGHGMVVNPKIQIINLTLIFLKIISYFSYVLIARVLMSWVSPDPSVFIVQFIYYITEPVLAPLRKIIPPLGVIDLSPMVAFFIIYMLKEFILRILGSIAW